MEYDISFAKIYDINLVPETSARKSRRNRYSCNENNENSLYLM